MSPFRLKQFGTSLWLANVGLTILMTYSYGLFLYLLADSYFYYLCTRKTEHYVLQYQPILSTVITNSAAGMIYGINKQIVLYGRNLKQTLNGIENVQN